MPEVWVYFVDVGIKHDGLIHVSHLADHFVKNPAAIVKVGDIAQIRVLEVDIERKRIALSMRKN